MMHVALGWKYRDRKVRQGAVVYCALEGCAAFKNRIEAFRQAKLADNASEVPFQPDGLANVARSRSSSLDSLYPRAGPEHRPPSLSTP